jgi:hypothetical protein
MGTIWALCDFGRKGVKRGKRKELNDHSIIF